MSERSRRYSDPTKRSPPPQRSDEAHLLSRPGDRCTLAPWRDQEAEEVVDVAPETSPDDRSGRRRGRGARPRHPTIWMLIILLVLRSLGIGLGCLPTAGTHRVRSAGTPCRLASAREPSTAGQLQPAATASLTATVPADLSSGERMASWSPGLAPPSRNN